MGMTILFQQRYYISGQALLLSQPVFLLSRSFFSKGKDYKCLYCKYLNDATNSEKPFAQHTYFCSSLNRWLAKCGLFKHLTEYNLYSVIVYSYFPVNNEFSLPQTLKTAFNRLQMNTFAGSIYMCFYHDYFSQRCCISITQLNYLFQSIKKLESFSWASVFWTRNDTRIGSRFQSFLFLILILVCWQHTDINMLAVQS